MFGILSNMLFVNNILRLPLLERIRVFCDQNNYTELNQEYQDQISRAIDSTDSDNEEQHQE